MTALVEPPIAALTLTAFSNAALVMICDGRTPSAASVTIRCPACMAVSSRRESAPGQAADPGSCMPRVSARQAIVDAVPMVMQWPQDLAMPLSAITHSACVIRPAASSASNFQTCVPEPTSPPRNFPLSIGPPVTMIAGRSALAAAISIAGVVLSQPDSSTTPSSGFARSSSSTSMAMRLRNSIAVGRISVSPSDIVGNSSGKPPASQTPRLTASATPRRCALHGVSSDQLFAMPITGRPSKTSGTKPSARSHER